MGRAPENRTDEEVEEIRHCLAVHLSAPRPIPEGKTLEDMIVGAWPGDETDEQIREALESAIVVAGSFYLLDANVLVHYVRGSAVWDFVRETYQPLTAEPRPIVSVVTVGEIRSLAIQ